METSAIILNEYNYAISFKSINKLNLINFDVVFYQ